MRESGRGPAVSDGSKCERDLLIPIGSLPQHITPRCSRRVCVCAVSTALNFYSGRNISCGIGERERGKRDGLETGRSVGKREREKIHSKSIAEPRHTQRERETGEKHTAPSPPCVRLAVSAFQSRSRAASRRAALNHALSSHLLPPFDFFVFFLREELLICVLKHITCLILFYSEDGASSSENERERTRLCATPNPDPSSSSCGRDESLVAIFSPIVVIVLVLAKFL